MPYHWLPLALDRLTDIEPGEVLQALTGARRWPRPAAAEDTGVRVLTIWARTKAGKALMVAVRPLDGRDWEIIAVGQLTADQLKELEAWEEQRGE